MDKPIQKTASTKLTPKSIAGRFKIVREIGRGGAGVVYEGVQLSVDRRVALKVLHADHQAKEDHVERFTREAKAIARLSHTNCITLFDFGFSEEFRAHYMAIEFIEGEELFAVTRERKLPFNIAMQISIQIAEALAHAHKHGILHRDLKPENVLVTPDWEIKVLDFGLARLLDLFAADSGGRRLTTQGAIFGTPAYMSPEQCAGDLDVTVRSDVYSLGIVMYELFEGALPFQATDVVKILVQQAKDPPPPMVADVPIELKELIMQMLEKDPQARPRTGTQVADRLREIMFTMATDAIELTADVSQELQRSLLRGLDRTDQTGESIRITEDGLESHTEPLDDELELDVAATIEAGDGAVGDYELGAEIATGPNGTVFRAVGPKGVVAVRVMTENIPKPVRTSPSFERRLSTIQQITGPTIVPLIDHGFEARIGRVFLVSELADGDTLEEVCRAGRAPTELATLVAIDIARALKVAHSLGVSHRGLRPTNVTLEALSDGRPRAKCMDFGVADVGGTPPRLTAPDTPLDVLRYAAPEQLRGEVGGPASDLYSLGVILYQLLSGHVPFNGKTQQALSTQVLGARAPALSNFVREVPLAMSELVAQLLDKNPAKRPRDADEVIERLDTIRTESSTADLRAELGGGATDLTAVWRLRRGVQAPAPGTQTVSQRAVPQGTSDVHRPNIGGVTTHHMAAAAAVLVIFTLLLIIVSGGC